MKGIAETHKILELVVPRRLECPQDLTDALEVFEAALNKYVFTHPIGAMVEVMRGREHVPYRVLSGAHMDLVRTYDKQRLKALFPNDERLESSIPMAALLNKYEALAEHMRDFLARNGQLQQWEVETIKYEYLGEPKP